MRLLQSITLEAQVLASYFLSRIKHTKLLLRISFFVRPDDITKTLLIAFMLQWYDVSKVEVRETKKRVSKQ
jgi:hypothetical protein